MVDVRQATPDDVPDIIHVCRRAWSVTYADLHTEDYIARVLDEYYNPERVLKEVRETSRNWNGYWVAERDGQILGCIGGGVNEKNAGHIYVFYVLPELKRQGIGSALLEQFTQYQQETYGITEQWVTSVTEGNLMAIPFYEGQGFFLDHATENPEGSHLPGNLHYHRSL